MTRFSTLAVALCVSVTACQPARAPMTDSADIADGPLYAFVNVNVVPMDGGGENDRGRILEEQMVLVEGGRIRAVGPASDVAVPENATRIDGTGRYLMPGLAEMHGHLPNPNMPEEVTENVLFLYVANGVTLVRGMQGNPSQLALRERVDSGELPGPRLVLGSPSMAGNRVETVEQAKALVREYEEAGFDLLKVHEGLTPEVYDALARTAKEVGIPFAGHVSDHVGLFHALEAGQTTIDHLDNFIQALVPEGEAPEEPPGLRGVGALIDRVDESRMPQVIEAVLAADASVVPTMVLWESGIFATRPSSELMAERTEVQYMPVEMVDQWAEAVDDRLAEAEPEAMQRVAALRRRILKALHDGGVRVLLGTDSPQIFSVPGFSIHREMRLYQEVGMTPYEVLASGTSVVGDYYGESFGRVDVGQRADLLLLEANPLEDVANVSRLTGIVVNGRFWSEEAIATRLEAIAESYRSTH